MREKRSEHRVYKMARVDVVWMDETGIQHISQGKLEDLSEGGCAFESMTRSMQVQH